MAVITPPIFLQAGSHAADSVRRALGGLVLYRNSIVASGDWAVTQNGTPNMSVNCAEGRGLVIGTEATYQGGYLCESQGVTNLAITAANASNPRIDLIVARVKDAAYSGATNTFTLEVVTGTAAASPVPPALPVDCFQVASIAVAAAVTSIVTANVTDTRTTTTSGLLAAAGAVVTCTSATRPATAVRGMVIYETDTGNMLQYYGATTGWQKPWNLPWGRVGNGAQFDVTTTSTTKLTAGATGSLATLANRQYIWRLELSGGMFGSVLNDNFTIGIEESGGAVISTVPVDITAAGKYVPPGSFVVSGTATTASHVWQAYAQRTAGTGTLTFRGRLFIYDDGPNGNAPTV